MKTIKVGDQVDVISRPSDIFHDFTGTVVSLGIEHKTGEPFFNVKDQDGDVFSCDRDQVSFKDV